MMAMPLSPILPVDRRLCIPLVHADDVAAAFASAIERKAARAFNVAADPPLGRDDVAKVLHARKIHRFLRWASRLGLGNKLRDTFPTGVIRATSDIAAPSWSGRYCDPRAAASRAARSGSTAPACATVKAEFRTAASKTVRS